jgi:hypothetical protein
MGKKTIPGHLLVSDLAIQSFTVTGLQKKQLKFLNVLILELKALFKEVQKYEYLKQEVG